MRSSGDENIKMDVYREDRIRNEYIYIWKSLEQNEENRLRCFHHVMSRNVKGIL